MFLNARGCWKNNLCQRIGFTGPSDAVTEQECMDRAMCIFLGFFNESLKYGSYWHVVTLYQSVLAVEHDQGMNEYGRAVLKRLKFLIKHAHCKHYYNVLYPDQTEYILQRNTALAMGLHSRLGRHSLLSLTDPAIAGMISTISLENDLFLSAENNYTSLHNRFAALYAADWDE